jgi:tetratricopeptide (TPR) repeat protein
LVVAEKRGTGLDSMVAHANKLYYADNYVDAVAEYSRLINIDSTNGEYYYKRGFSYAKLLFRKKAIQDFQNAIRFHFKSASACYNIGVNSSYDDDSFALYYFKKSLELDPSLTQARQDMIDCEMRLKKRGITH